MFDIKLMAHPGKLYRQFLSTDRVADQKMGRELKNSLKALKNPYEEISFKGNFWKMFLVSFYRLILTIATLRVFGTLSLLVAIFASRQILDDKNPFSLTLLFIAGYLVFQSMEAIFGAFSRKFQQEAGLGIKTFFTTLVNQKLLRVDHTKSKGFTSGNLKVLISSDTERVSQFIITILWNFMPAILSLLILGPVIIHQMGIPGVVAVFSTLLTLPLIIYLGKYTDLQETKMKSHEDILASIIGEWVSNIRLLRYLGLQRSFRMRIKGSVRKYTIESTIQHVLFIIGYGFTFVWWLAPILLMMVTTHLLNRPTDLKTVFSVIWMLNHMQGFIRFMPSAILQYNSANACVRRLTTFLKQPEFKEQFLPSYPIDGLQAKLPKSLVLEGVSFSYNGKPVIQDMTTTFDLQKKSCIIGRVGSGKSTLLHLLSGDLKPDKGKITLVFEDGVTANIWHENIHDYLKRFASYVGQEPYLSNMTLSGNVSLDEAGDRENIMSNLYFAGLKADVATFEKGISQEIGENGINLSGGQKQRVNLARGFHARRPFTFLDDPLSAVDTEMESFLMETILKNMQAFIMVSHRLSGLKQTDRLIILENGRIVADDSPQNIQKSTNFALSEYVKHLNTA